MNEKIFRGILLFFAAGAFISIFIYKDVSGDIGNITWRIAATKTHLASEWSMPYYTPVRCGGFLLAADAQDFIFSFYMFANYFILNELWVCKIVNFLLSIILGLGVAQWIKYFGITNSVVRTFCGILVPLSGYWVYHMVHAGELWAHGLAYTPWIMILIEELLEISPQNNRKYMIRVVSLVGLLFLLTNSGYYWLQFTVPLIFARVFVELVSSRKRFRAQLKKIFIIALIGIFSLLLGSSRFGGMYEYQYKKFPRDGGSVGHLQVIGDTFSNLEMHWHSFFNAGFVIDEFFSPTLGQFHEYTNFIGVLSIPMILLGCTRLKTLFKSRIFMSLVLASLCQWGLTRTTHAGDLLRFFIPVYNQVTWYWRGSAVLILLLIIFIASGYEILFKSNKKVFLFIGMTLMILNLSEIFYVHLKKMDFSLDPPLNKIMQTRIVIPQPLDRFVGPCALGNIFGYGRECASQLTFTKNKYQCGLEVSVYDSPDPDYFNMHDVRRLAGPEADHAFYVKNDWPLWPKDDSDEFLDFINFKQVIPVPLHLRILNVISIVSWSVYLGMVVMVCFFYRGRATQD